MSIEAPRQPKQTQEQNSQLTAEEQAWKDEQDARWAKYYADLASEKDHEEQGFLDNVFNEDVVPLSPANQDWLDHHNSLQEGPSHQEQDSTYPGPRFGEGPRPYTRSRTHREEGFLNSVLNEDDVPLSKANQDWLDHHNSLQEQDVDSRIQDWVDHYLNSLQEPSRLSRLKASLGAVATKITDAFNNMRKPAIPQSPEEFKLPSPPVAAETTSTPETEKQPRFSLVDIKARAVEIVDRVKYSAGLAKEIGGEVKDILAEKAKDTFSAAKDKFDKDEIIATAKEKAGRAKDAAIVAKHTVMDKAWRAKDIGIGLAGYAVTEGPEFLGMLIAKSAELAKDAPNRLSERFTEAAPTPSNPNNRELNRRGKILVLGLGITAVSSLAYLGRMIGVDPEGIDLANQVPLDNPGIDTVLPDMPDQLPMADAAPDVIDTHMVEPAGSDLKVDFSPEIGTLEAGDNIWDDSMQMLKESGFNGTEQELIDRTNLLTEWRLNEMGITPEQAKYLPVGTELPMPELADMQELIAKAEALKR